MKQYVKFTCADSTVVTMEIAQTSFPDPPFRDVVPGDIVLSVSDYEGTVLQKAGHCDETAWESPNADAEMKFAFAIREYLASLATAPKA